MDCFENSGELLICLDVFMDGYAQIDAAVWIDCLEIDFRDLILETSDTDASRLQQIESC